MYSEQKEALAQEIELKRPAVLAVSGLHNSGKTTLLEKLLPALRSRGLKVGIIKHDGHDFTPDVPGTDSYRLREAGAEGVAVYSGQRYLLTEMFRLTEQDLLALFERHGYDLVLLEGFKDSGWPKIEVVRKEISDFPAAGGGGRHSGGEFWIGRCAGSGRLARCPDAKPVRRKQI
mgnify:CR=1 FL=1